MNKKGIAVVFVNNNGSDRDGTKQSAVNSVLSQIRLHLSVPPGDLPRRFLESMIPPVSHRYRSVHVDLLGPLLILITLAGLLHYGHASKLPSAALLTSPSQVLLIYVGTMPFLTYIMIRLSQANISFWGVLSLLGYGLFGHILTLATSLLFYQEKSNGFFFCCMALFGGLCALRVALVLLAVIGKPAARLVVCSVVATLQLLLLVFLHFAYMHRTFVYGAGLKHKH
uniref:Protein YIPF3 n=1 Tax=Timema cristinae TaxID=61476 RepID=A0A7R9H4B7_TIMCR|nr:unnamed protein product [Timema cristinae]